MMAIRSSTVRYDFMRDHKRCEACGYDVESLLQAHHCVHIAKGGEDSPDNLLALCPTCHKAAHKWNRWNTEECSTREGTIKVIQWAHMKGSGTPKQFADAIKVLSTGPDEARALVASSLYRMDKCAAHAGCELAAERIDLHGRLQITANLRRWITGQMMANLGLFSPDKEDMYSELLGILDTYEKEATDDFNAITAKMKREEEA